jgi:hypothetical protein
MQFVWAYKYSTRVHDTELNRLIALASQVIYSDATIFAERLRDVESYIVRKNAQRLFKPTAPLGDQNQ